MRKLIKESAYIQYIDPKCVHIPGRLRTVQVGQAVGKVVQVGRATGGVAIATYRRRHALAFGILKFDAVGSFYTYM